MTKLLKIVALGLAIIPATSVAAQEPVQYFGSVVAQASSGDYAPYMLGSWNQGRYTEASGIWQEAGISKSLNLNKRFSWGAGVQYIIGYGSPRQYGRYDSETGHWYTHEAHFGRARIQNLYGEVKYRSVFLEVGMKNHHSKIVDDNLTSGDLVRSNNASNIPGIGAGFIDFVDIPFTKGWVQIDGEIMYGKMTDSDFKKNQFNYYSNLLAVNLWYTYKRCYFRSKANQPFRFTVGMQAAGLFAGSSTSYSKGQLVRRVDRGFRFKDLFSMFLPTEGGESYYQGSHLGSWDLKAEYLFKNGTRLTAYAEWPWEDGSGIGRMNGWDGLWGLEYELAAKGIVSKIVIEYLDFTNQSGPIHYSPVDHPDSPLTGHADGGDNYYNNTDYGAYANYGLSIGTPFLKAPYYNADGNPDFLRTRSRGFHAAICGKPSERWHYRVMFSHQVAGGNGRVPAVSRVRSTSAMIEASAQPFRKLRNLEIGVRMGLDTGSLWGNNFGAQLKVAYHGHFNLKRK